MSSTSRDRILAAIGSSQNAVMPADTETLTISERLQRRPRGPLPILPGDLEATFVMHLKAAAATCSTVAAAEQAEQQKEQQIGQQVLQWLQQQNAALSLTRSESEMLDSVDWPEALDVIKCCDNTISDTTVCEAFCAIAETGSLVMLSSRAAPTTLNYLPDNFICLLHRQTIVPHIEDVWQRVRTESAGMPRALNIITGPSRTADVEQTIQLGAHGPRRMHVILYS
jgi:L-lactate dehydrogenase complex protein LldG